MVQVGPHRPNTLVCTPLVGRVTTMVGETSKKMGHLEGVFNYGPKSGVWNPPWGDQTKVGYGSWVGPSCTNPVYTLFPSFKSALISE